MAWPGKLGIGPWTQKKYLKKKRKIVTWQPINLLFVKNWENQDIEKKYPNPTLEWESNLCVR